jgi:peptide/nickel transport system permease protein
MSVSALTEGVAAGAIARPSAAPEAARCRSPWQLALQRWRRDRAAIVSGSFLLLVVAMAVFAPVIASVVGHGVNQQFRTSGLSPSGLPVGPSHRFLLGTDDLGRDILVRLAYGARVSLVVGVVATGVAVAVGTVVGILAGFVGGVTDSVLSRLADVVLSFPFLLFAIALVSILRPSLWITIAVIGMFSWASVARVVRGQVLSVREKEYVEAARSLGRSSARIMAFDVLPNVVPTVIVYATLLVPTVIVTEATLSFLGVGVPPPTPSWGSMISEASALYQQAWWFALFPGLLLLATTLAFNLLGDAVRDALDPRADRAFRL